MPIVLADAFKLGFSRDQKQVERYIKLIEQRIIALPYKTWFTLQDTENLICRTRRQRLESVIEQALADNGTVLIPAFSIGRTQELLYELEDIIHRKKLNATRLAANPPLPSGERAGVRGKANSHDKADVNWPQLSIILDSPLACRFTQVYRDLKPFWDNEALQRVKQGRNPLGFEQLLTVDSHQAHLAMVRHLTILLKNSLGNFCAQKSVAYVEI